MARTQNLQYAMNRGEISTLLLGRTDLEHLRLAAEIQCNWLPRVLGPMTFRPGSAYVGTTNLNYQAKMLPFIAAFDDTATIELTPNIMRVRVNDELVTRAAVAAVVPALSTWTTTTTGTATANVGSGAITFANANVGSYATATTAMAIGSSDLQTEHAVRIAVTNGPVIFRIGSTSGGNDIFADETLDTGTYSMAFTPGVATVYLQFLSTEIGRAHV